MDINQLATGPKSNDGVWMTIRHPMTGMPIKDGDKEARIKILSTQSRKYKEFIRRALTRRVIDQNVDPKANSDEISEMMTELIVDWEGLTANGEPFPHSDENARILLDKCPWLADQINVHAADIGRYMGEPLPVSDNGPSSSSGSTPRGRAVRASGNTPRK